MYEGLREVAAELPLLHVVLLRVEPGGPACGPVAFEPAGCCDRVAGLVRGHGGGQSAEQEGTLGFAERSLVGAEPVDVLVALQVALYGGEGCAGAWIVGGQGTANRGQEQRRIQPWVAFCALPPASGVGGAFGGVREDGVGQFVP